MPEFPIAAQALSRIREIAGILIEELPASGARGLSLRVTACAEYGQEDSLHALLGALLDRAPWAGAPSTAFQPDSRARRTGCEIDLALPEPPLVLASGHARTIAIAGEPPDAVRTALEAGWMALCTAAGVDPDDRLFLAREFVAASSMAYGGDAAEIQAGALEGIGPAGAPILADLAQLAQLEKDRRRGLADLEEALAALRTAGRRKTGRLSTHGAWAGITAPRAGEPPSRPAFGGGNDLPETGAAEVSTDLDALESIVSDETLPERERLDALREIESAGGEAAADATLRALSHPAIFLNAIHHAPLERLASLLIDVVRSNDERRAASALTLLRDWGTRFRSCAELWTAAAGSQPDPGFLRMLDLYRGSLIARWTATGDRTLIPFLIERLRERLDDPLLAATIVTTLGDLRAAEASSAVLDVAKKSGTPACAQALRFFSRIPFPAAVPVLTQALASADGHERGAALEGLSGQGEAGVATVLAEAQRLASGGASEENDSPLSSALWALMNANASTPEELLARAAEVGAGSKAAAARCRVYLKPPGGSELASEESAGGQTAEERLERRRVLWTSAGYAEGRYRRDGDRSALWDAEVERGHAAYVRGDLGSDPAARTALEKAIERGCGDGMVLYRAAVGADLAHDPARARLLYQRALEDLARRYPHAPYVSAAAERLAAMAGERGDIEAAAALAARAVAHEAHSTAVERMAEDFGMRARLVRVARTLAPFDASALRSRPGWRHSAAVSSISLSRDGEMLASADASGAVQLSALVRGPHGPDLDPRSRARLHAAGPTLVRWLDSARLLSSGADRRVLVLRRDGDALVIEKTLSVDESITALGPPLPGIDASAIASLGDDAGRLLALHGDGTLVTIVRFRLRSIRRVLSAEGRAVVLDEASHLGVLDTGGATRTLDPGTQVSAGAIALVSPDSLVVSGAERTIVFHPGTGDEIDQGEAGPPAFALFMLSDGRSVTALLSGRIEVERGSLIAGSPIVAIDIAADRIATADRTGRLSVYAFR